MDMNSFDGNFFAQPNSSEPENTVSARLPGARLRCKVDIGMTNRKIHLDATVRRNEDEAEQVTHIFFWASAWLHVWRLRMYMSNMKE